MKKQLLLLIFFQLTTYVLVWGQLSAPTNLSASASSSSQINLTWSDNATFESGYQVERSNDGSNFSKIADLGANTTNYANTGLAASTKYYYRVRAVSAAGASGYSRTVEATTQAPPINFPNTPSNLSAVAISSSQINLTWTDNATNEMGYVVERSTDGVIFFKIADLGANSASFENTGLTASTKYWYRAQAVSAAANSGFSNVAEATTQAPPIVIPQAPTNLFIVSISSVEVVLQWTDNATNESGYQVERSVNGTDFVKIADLGANVTTYSNGSLTPQKSYWYRVQAVSPAANSSYSNVVNTTTPPIPPKIPETPQNLRVQPLDFELVRLNWNPVSSLAKTIIIERSKKANDGFVQIAQISAQTVEFFDKEILDLTDYYYRIKAANAEGSSSYSNLAMLSAGAIITSIQSNVPDPIAIFSVEHTLYIKNADNSRAQIFDLRGISHADLQIPTAQWQSNMTYLSSGLYIIRLQKDNQVITQKILIP
jgi:transcriptional regulator CtsR